MKKIKYLTIAFLLLILPIGINAKKLELTDSNKYDTVTAEDQLLLPSYDNSGKINGHLICQTELSNYEEFNCTKYSLKNEIKWTKLVTPEYIMFNPITENIEDLGITVKGEMDFLIAKFENEEAEEPLWYAQFGGNNIDMPLVMINSYDDGSTHDGYIGLALTLSTDLENLTPGYAMVKYDLNGKLLWQKNIKNLSNVVFTAPEEQFMSGDTIITKATATNSNVFEKETSIYINKIIESRNQSNEVDGIIVVGTETTVLYNPNDPLFLISEPDIDETLEPNTTATSAVIVKYDLAGNEVWRKKYNPYTAAIYNDVILSKTPTGEIDGYLVVGAYVSAAEARILDELISYGNATNLVVGIIQKYDLDGNKVWEDTHIKDNANTSFNAILENYNTYGEFNGYIITGKLGEHEVLERKTDQIPADYQVTPAAKKLSATQLQLIEEPEYESEVYIVKYTYKNYQIEKEADKGGSITVNNNAFPGEIVPIEIKTEEGYVLERIVVTDKDGNELEVTNNSFVMPEGEVLVKATFKRLTNPETSAIGYTIVLILLIGSIATFIVRNQKQEVLED